MKKFSGKYEMLVEVALNRFQQGGFLIGDYVKIKKNALNNDYIKGMSDQYKDRIKQFKDSDVNLRICAVKSKYPDTSFGVVGSPDAPIGTFVDVVQEISHSNWVNPTTIPMDAVELVETEFYAPVPDSVKRPSPEPTEFDKDGTAKGDIGADDYMRMSKELNLTTKNTKLANANKWDDNKPGAGNTKNVDKPKKINDSVNINDEKILSEVYKTIYEDVPTASTELTDEQINSMTPDQLKLEIGKLPIGGNDPKIEALRTKLSNAARGIKTTTVPPQPDAMGSNPLANTSDQTSITTPQPEKLDEPGMEEPGGYFAPGGKGFNQPPSEPPTAAASINQQERRPDDARFNQLMGLRQQQMASDDNYRMMKLYQQNQQRNPQPQSTPIAQEAQPAPQQPQKNFWGQMGDTVKDAALNTIGSAGAGLAQGAGNATENIASATGAGAGNRAYDWAGGKTNPDRNDSRYNPGNQRNRGGRSRYQTSI